MFMVGIGFPVMVYFQTLHHKNLDTNSSRFEWHNIAATSAYSPFRRSPFFRGPKSQ